MNPLDARRRLLGRNVYKKTVEGNPAIAQGSLARRYPGITMQGWTEQAQYEGNQLFDASKYFLTEYSAGGATVVNNGDGSFTISGEGALTSDFNRGVFISGDEARTFLKSGIIRSNQHNYVPKLYCYAQDAEGGILFTTGSSGSASVTDEMLEQMETFRFVFYSTGGSTITPGVIWPMIYQDGDGTWEPYTGGQPSPNPDYPQDVKNAGKYNEETRKYEYQVKLTGANLFDYSPFVNDDGYMSSSYTTPKQVSPFHVEEGKKYVLITKGTIEVSDYSSIYFGEDDLSYFDGKTKILTTGLNYRAFSGGVQRRYIMTATKTCDITKCMVHGSGYIKNAYIVEEFGLFNYIDGVSENYEPYRTPQTATLTSDRPLTKWDKLEKRNGQWGWVYKSDYIDDVTEVCKILGQGTFGNVDDYKTLAFYLYANGTNGSINLGIDNTLRNQMMCNYFRFGNVYNSSTPNVFYFNGDYISFRVNAELLPDWSLESPSSQPFVDWLNKKKDEGDPVIIWYPTTEETFAPLSESEQEQMNELYTFRPTTVLSNDCECNMTLTYKTKKSLEVTT